MENIKDFLSMSEEEKIRRIKSLDSKEVIHILTSVGTNALSAELLNQLAVAYNNSIQPEKAMETLDLVKEQERDAKWYYRYGYACAAISLRLQEKKFLYQWKALEMIEKAIIGSKTQEVIDWCLEIMDLRPDLTELAKMNPSSFPRLSAYYLKARPDNEGSEEKEKYKKVSAIEWIFNQKEYLPDAFPVTSICIWRNGILMTGRRAWPMSLYWRNRKSLSPMKRGYGARHSCMTMNG